MLIPCPCCSALSYENCCQPYHLNLTKSATPEKLMRSRYSAYVLHLIAYLVQTTFPTKRVLYPVKEMENWAESTTWLRLEICDAYQDIVEFKAYYQNGPEKNVHHERSVFKQEDGIWYYFEGTYPN